MGKPSGIGSRGRHEGHDDWQRPRAAIYRHLLECHGESWRGNDVWTRGHSARLLQRGGLKTTDSKQVRWGENYIEDVSYWLNNNPVRLIRGTSFFSNLVQWSRYLVRRFTHEAQAVDGDPGGAVFSWDGSNWHLSGMMHAVKG